VNYPFFFAHPKNDTILSKIRLTLKSFRQNKRNAKITPIFACLDIFLWFCNFFLHNQLTDGKGGGRTKAKDQK